MWRISVLIGILLIIGCSDSLNWEIIPEKQIQMNTSISVELLEPKCGILHDSIYTVTKTIEYKGNEYQIIRNTHSREIGLKNFENLGVDDLIFELRNDTLWVHSYQDVFRDMSCEINEYQEPEILESWDALNVKFRIGRN